MIIKRAIHSFNINFNYFFLSFFAGNLLTPTGLYFSDCIMTPNELDETWGNSEKTQLVIIQVTFHVKYLQSTNLKKMQLSRW